MARKLEANMDLKKWNRLPAIVAVAIVAGPITVNAQVLTVLHSFSGLLGDGSIPMGGLVQASDGTLYGTTALGGAHFMGTVFGSAFGIVVTLHSFSGAPGEGAVPTAKL